MKGKGKISSSSETPKKTLANALIELEQSNNILQKLLIKKKFLQEKKTFYKIEVENLQNKLHFQKIEATHDLNYESQDSLFNGDRNYHDLIVFYQKLMNIALMEKLLLEAREEKEKVIIDYKWLEEKIDRNSNLVFNLKKGKQDLGKTIKEMIKTQILPKKNEENIDLEKRIAFLKKGYKLEIQNIQTNSTLESKLKAFEFKVQKTFLIKEISKLLERICNKNLFLVKDFEFQASLQDEDLFLTNLFFLGKKENFKCFQDKLEQEKKRETKKSMVILYEKTQNLLEKLKKYLLDESGNQKNSDKLKEFSINEINGDKSQIPKQLGNQSINENNSTKRYEEFIKEFGGKADRKTIEKAYISLANFVGKSINEALNILKNEAIEMFQKIDKKQSILKKHLEFLQEEFEEMKHPKKENNYMEKLGRVTKKFEVLTNEITREEERKKKLEENLKKAKKMYKIEYLQNQN